MTPSFQKIYFIHKGKEAYPEIAAYRSFFEGSFETQEIHPKKLAEQPDLARSICWHIMGFYRARLPAGLIIHDYRSLSVGKLHSLKDRIKGRLNATPDIRVYQNEAIQKALGIRDSIPSVFLPMGAPPEILSFRKAAPPPAFDFCYIGALSAERRTREMLDSFLRRYGKTKTFHLYGQPESCLVKRYQKHQNIVFEGKLPQKELFSVLRRARVAVNYFPNHAPHKDQTPTKLLEYAALGLRILSNEQPQSRLTSRKYGIHSLWGPAEDMFRNGPDVLDWQDNEDLDPAPFLWPDVIASSGLSALIDKMSQR